MYKYIMKMNCMDLVVADYEGATPCNMYLETSSIKSVEIT